MHHMTMHINRIEAEIEEGMLALVTVSIVVSLACKNMTQ